MFRPQQVVVARLDDRVDPGQHGGAVFLQGAVQGQVVRGMHAHELQPVDGDAGDQFAHLDNEIIRAARQGQAGAGFWGRIQAALAQWIVIRQAGSGDTPEGIVDRAQQFLAADRLADAIQELNRLPDAPKRVAQPWIRDAQRRLEIDTRITAIRQELSRS